MKLILLVFFLDLLSGCATTSYNTIQEGLLVHKHRFYDSNRSEHRPQYENRDLKIWFKDSAVIYEINNLVINSDHNNKETSEYAFDRYVYLDLTTMIHYDYKNFSDTAIPVRKYKCNDSSFVGWKFYGYQTNFINPDKLISVSDTIIKDVTYSRMKGEITETEENGTPNTTLFTYYLRCDKRNTLFHVDRRLDEQLNKCPATRIDIDFPGRSQNTISSFYEYDSEKLTKNEKKVFKKWKENTSNKDIKMDIEINVN